MELNPINILSEIAAMTNFSESGKYTFNFYINYLLETLFRESSEQDLLSQFKQICGEDMAFLLKELSQPSTMASVFELLRSYYSKEEVKSLATWVLKRYISQEFNEELLEVMVREGASLKQGYLRYRKVLAKQRLRKIGSKTIPLGRRWEKDVFDWINSKEFEGKKELLKGYLDEEDFKELKYRGVPEEDKERILSMPKEELYEYLYDRFCIRHKDLMRWDVSCLRK